MEHTERVAVSRQEIFEASSKFFLEPIAPLLADDSITEVMVNGCNDVYVERHGRLEKTAQRFESEDALRSAIHNVAQWVGREITEEHPVLEARLPNGSRIHAIIPPSARDGTYLTIRKFAREAYDLDDFVCFGSISPIAKEFLELCVRLQKNILISGGTGTGKTSLLGALAREIPEAERLVVIEDTAELRLKRAHCLYLEAKHADAAGRGTLDVRELFRNSLRMRPDRIIVGEVRGGEALDMIQSMLSGHAGSMSTIHANTPFDALIRLETLSLMSDVDLPVYVARAQVSTAIHLLIQIARFSEDGSRRVTRITEASGLNESERYDLRDLFVCQRSGRTSDGQMIVSLDPTGRQPTFAHAPWEQGLDSSVRLSGSLWTQQVQEPVANV